MSSASLLIADIRKHVLALPGAQVVWLTSLPPGSKLPAGILDGVDGEVNTVGIGAGCIVQIALGKKVEHTWISDNHLNTSRALFVTSLLPDTAKARQSHLNSAHAAP